MQEHLTPLHHQLLIELFSLRLTDFTVEKGSDLILTLPEPVNLDKQISASLLQPGDPIWKGELQEKSDDFADYKYEIILSDIRPKVTSYLMSLANENHGDYDGWETYVIK